MKSILALCMTLSFGFTHLFSQSEIIGNWITSGEQGSGIVEIYKTADGKYDGRFVKALNPEQDQLIREKLRKEGKEEMMVIEDLEYKGDGQWTNGTIYSVSRDIKFDCKTQLIDARHMKVTGYLGVTLLGKTFTWKKQ